MINAELKELLNEEKTPYADNLITAQNLAVIDEYILQNVISEETFGIYKKFVAMKQDAPYGMKQELFTAVKNYARSKLETGNTADALLMWRFLTVKSNLTAQNCYDIAETLFAAGLTELSETVLRVYERTETNLPLKFLSVANFYNMHLHDYKKAIKYYEKYLKIEETKSAVYTVLGNLYKKAYGDDSLKEQIYCYEKAYKLKPDDRLSLHCLAFDYEKLGDRENAGKYYRELLQNNPTDTDYYNYGGFLINSGNLYEGHKYFTHRFKIDDINLKYPQNLDISKKWDFKTDLSGKTLLIHYEQGFGDTFMYCRFLPQMKNLAKRIIFVVQDEVYTLLKSSTMISEGIELISDKTNISNIDYDYNMALLDCPFVLKTDIETIPFTDKYLCADEEKIKAYKNKYIKPSGNLKIGISYKGSQAANYKGRDIEISKLSGLFSIQNADFYSFNAEKENYPNITNLYDTFNDFSDTAAALKNMDVVVSTDNVILNLAGALGITTYALLNKYPNFRWFKTKGSDIGWYKSVVPLQTEAEDVWLPIISQAVNLITANK